MTLIDLSALSAGLGLPGPLARGEVRLQRWAGSGSPVIVEGEHVVFPADVRVEIIDGAPQHPLEVEPTDGTFCYRLIVSDARTGRQLEWYVAVPNAESVPVGDLPRVDPATFEPTGGVVAAWEAVLSEVHAAAGNAAQSATGAAESARLADESAVSASGSAASAAEAAGVAGGHAQAASESRAGAETARTDAEGYATAAGLSAQEAAGSATAAAGSASAAEQARASMIVTGLVIGDDLVLETVEGASIPAGDVRGPTGSSAYEVAVNAGFTGTEDEWLASLHGADSTVPGPPGEPTAFELRGSGMPNGVVTAPPGTYYTDVLGTNGAWRWIKKSGTGSTGWEVVYGDTGWRDVTDLVDPVWKTALTGAAGSRNVRMKRTESLVTLRLLIEPADSLVGVARYKSQGLLSLPIGFKNGGYTSIGYGRASSPNSIAEFNTGGTIGMIRTYTMGEPDTSSWISGHYLSAEFSFITDNPWPTTLPGTPA